MERTTSHALPPRDSIGRMPLSFAGVAIAPWLTLAVASVLIAGLTLLYPSAPTYDPWAWIIWGREIAHVDLQTTGGPSWKPLPVMFTTVFSIFGSWAPDLWLVTARAGAIMSLVAAFLLVRRLGGGWVGAVAAVAGIAMAPWFMRNAAYGNSEPLLVALLLGTVERDLAGHKKVAFGLAVGAALLRPEAWPFLALYSLWLVYKRDIHWAVVAASGVAVVALWTLPELWGSGDWLRAAHRAQDPNAGAATFAKHPFLEVFHNAGRMLTVPVILGLLAVVSLVYFKRDRRIALLLALAVAWTALVAYMTAGEGFSGNNRYVIPGVAIVIVLAGVGAGWLVQKLPRNLRRLDILAAIVLVVAFSWIGVGRLGTTLHAIKFQSNLINALPGLVERAGGAEKLKRCGHIYTGPLLIPAVAWQLKLHTLAVGYQHPVSPAVVFRERTDGAARRKAVPAMYDVSGHNLALAPNWRVVADCGK